MVDNRGESTADGRITLGVDQGAGYSIGCTVRVPLPWREGDPTPPDASHLFNEDNEFLSRGS